jgi:hypothetical protein
VSGYNLADTQDREDRRKHLELVSKVVDRMASGSAAAKGWSITVAGAAFGVAVVQSSWFIFLLGVAALAVFGYLDGSYLHTEKKYRDLYAAILRNEIEPLSMDTKGLDGRRLKRDSHRSWSVLGFYGPLAVAGVILTVVAISRADAEHDQPPSHFPNAPAPASPAPEPKTTTMPSSTPAPSTSSASSSPRPAPAAPPGNSLVP